MRKVLVYLNSPRNIEISEDIQTWGQLKSLLNNEYGYQSNISGFISDSGITLDKPDQEIPNKDFKISLILHNTKYGI